MTNIDGDIGRALYVHESSAVKEVATVAAFQKNIFVEINCKSNFHVRSYEKMYFFNNFVCLVNVIIRKECDEGHFSAST